MPPLKIKSHLPVPALFLFFALLLHAGVVSAQHIVHSGSKFGLTDESGAVVLATEYDLIKGAKFKDLANDGTMMRGPFYDNLGYPIDFFIVKKNNKYAYVVREYRYFILGWGSGDNVKRSGVSPDVVNWKISAFEFDDLWCIDYYKDETLDENEPYDYQGRHCTWRERTYCVLGYRKNGKEGIITVEEMRRKIYRETKNNYTSDSILVSLENTTVHEALVDNLVENLVRPYRSSDLYRSVQPTLLTELKGKIGMMDVLYGTSIEPQFDTLPVFFGEYRLWRKLNGHHYDSTMLCFFARENMRWGLMHLQQGKMTTDIPFRYQALDQVDYNADNKFYCKGINDTLTLFDRGSDALGNEKKEDYKVLFDGKPFVFDATNKYRVDLFKYGPPGSSWVLITRDTAHSGISYRVRLFDQVYLADIAGKKMRSWNEKGTVYHLVKSEQNTLVESITEKDGRKICNLYDPASGELKSSFEIDADSYVSDESVDTPLSSYQEAHSGDIVTAFYENTAKGKKKIIGYYDFIAGRFSKSRPAHE